FLVAALAMLLLCAGVIFKLARRHTQSVRRDRRMGPRRLRPSQAVRANQAGRVNMNEAAVRSKDFARRLPTATRQRPSSIDSAHDIKASLRKIMDDLERRGISAPLRGAAHDAGALVTTPMTRGGACLSAKFLHVGSLGPRSLRSPPSTASIASM